MPFREREASARSRVCGCESQAASSDVGCYPMQFDFLCRPICFFRAPSSRSVSLARGCAGAGMAKELTALVDRQISVITNDGRNIIGILRGFDQVTNLILE